MINVEPSFFWPAQALQQSAETAERLEAAALESACRVNVGRLSKIEQSFDDEGVFTRLVDADGAALATLRRRYRMLVISIEMTQHAEPSFVFT
jgi:hypothetical protein